MLPRLRQVLSLEATRAITRLFYKRPRAPIPVASAPKALATLLTSTTGSVLYLNNQKQIKELDKELDKASLAGEKALLSLLDVLKNRITDVSAQYQKCMEQQMTILKEVDEIGDANEMMKQYANITNDLKIELANLSIVATTVGRMLQLEAMKQVTDNKNSLKLMEKKCKELDVLLNKEDLNVKKVEKSFMDAQKAFLDMFKGK